MFSNVRLAYAPAMSMESRDNRRGSLVNATNVSVISGSLPILKKVELIGLLQPVYLSKSGGEMHL